MKSVPRAAPPPPIPPARYERSNSATLAPLQRTGGSRRRRLGCFFREALQRRGRPVNRCTTGTSGRAKGGERNGETRTSVCPGSWYLGRSRIKADIAAQRSFWTIWPKRISLLRFGQMVQKERCAAISAFILLRPRYQEPGHTDVRVSPFRSPPLARPLVPVVHRFHRPSSALQGFPEKAPQTSTARAASTLQRGQGRRVTPFVARGRDRWRRRGARESCRRCRRRP